MAFDNILVVCVGNICRSPIAAALLKQQYPQKHIDSAGLSAVVGNPVDPNSQEIMDPYDISMSDHIAKQITEELTASADIILTMSANQSKWIEERWPHCRGKTFRIGHWIDKDIADPYKHEKSAFETARQDIVSSLEQWTDKIS
ncbi:MULTISPECIES: low molecular weight protein-tyrosine-phosphatase [unclassified Psychrobacter]|uniref:low molecular weight protein-tyrosine-phosphatase n=1 Tax=unclassified Psychrobacter TaxID=196806 RepID=UPI0025B5873F|nr:MULTISPECIES: low molecular weight protein-tyrosine-phosphatase [unclassified Psychrobacter]MDN3453869.1 low molecular weight protein-tyrosine-phosphatase [Psychrobacter sp. APC 3350]MDN3502061.1 low molecular weight protein-tyrosine-phosphatase [Psychrobacter sp. 5A.1]